MKLPQSFREAPDFLSSHAFFATAPAPPKIDILAIPMALRHVIAQRPVEAIREANVQHQASIRLASAAAFIVMLGFLNGCHQKAPPVATPADVASAQREAQREVEQAQIEAKKDVKSEAKIMGADSKDVARARVTGAFDVAMARADGDRKVAIQECMTLDPSAQQSCKDKAEVGYQEASAKAKANRASLSNSGP